MSASNPAAELTEALSEHFVMWHDMEGDDVPKGEWRCQCGAKFGFSHNAIDHQAQEVAARLAAGGAAADEGLRALAAEAINAVGGSHSHWREGGAGGACRWMTENAPDMCPSIEDVLEEHQPVFESDGDYGEMQWVECSCGDEYFVDTDADEATHRAHVADRLRAAGVTREEARAESELRKRIEAALQMLNPEWITPQGVRVIESILAAVPEEARPENEVKAEALREAADEWRDGDGWFVPFDGPFSPARIDAWLCDRADRLSRDGEAGS